MLSEVRNCFSKPYERTPTIRTSDVLFLLMDRERDQNLINFRV